MRMCKQCKLFDIEAAKSKSGAVLSIHAVKCLWESTEPYPMSLGISGHRPTPGYVTAKQDATNCPCFEPR